MGAGALEPAARPHQTMAFCCKQSQGSLPGALSLSLALSVLLSFLPLTAHIQSAYHHPGLSDKCAPVHHKPPLFHFLFVHKDHQPGSATDKYSNSSQTVKARWKAKPKGCPERTVKTKSPEQLFDCTAWSVMFLCLFIGKCNLCSEPRLTRGQRASCAKNILCDYLSKHTFAYVYC